MLFVFYVMIFFMYFFFFFQAEDGIRDYKVTGGSDVCSSDLLFKQKFYLKHIAQGT